MKNFGKSCSFCRIVVAGVVCNALFLFRLWGAEPAETLRAGNHLQLRWPSETGQSYVILYRTNLAVAWQLLAMELPAAMTGTNDYLHGSVLFSAQSFWTGGTNFLPLTNIYPWLSESHTNWPPVPWEVIPPAQAVLYGISTPDELENPGGFYRVFPASYTNSFGLPVWWEVLYGVSNPNDDTDGDGMTNAEEFSLGRNPLVNEVSQVKGTAAYKYDAAGRLQEVTQNGATKVTTVPDAEANPQQIAQ